MHVAGPMMVQRILSLIVAPLLIALLLQSIGDVGTRDSIAYWSAVQAFLAGDNPYDLDTLRKIQLTAYPLREKPQLFLNPPWVLPLLVPIFRWNFATSSFLLLSINISCTLVALQRLGKLVAPLPPRYLAIVGGFFPILSCWYFGQLSCFLLIGSLLSLEWIVHNFRPWWKVALALALFSSKPQTPYLLVIALLVAIARRPCSTDVFKTAALALVPVSFLAYHNEMLGWWFSSFAHSTQWATSSLPSLAYSLLCSYNQPFLIFIPAFIIAILVLAFDRGEISAHRFITYMVISSLTAPYAWIFDFSPLMIITYMVMAIAVYESLSPLRRAAYVVAVAALCVPFEALFTNNLQAYALHPIIVAALLIATRRELCDFIKKTEPQRAPFSNGCTTER